MFHSHGLSSQSAYDILHGKSYCDCGNENKFLGFVKGYSTLCVSCNDKRARAAAAATRSAKGEKAWNSGKKLVDHKDDVRFQNLSSGIKKSLQTRKQWNFLLTKETSEILKETSSKISSGIKRYYSTRRHSAYGLTSETSKFIKDRAKKISSALRSHHGFINEKLKTVDGWNVIEELESFTTFDQDRTQLLGRCTVCGHARYRTPAGWLFTKKVHCSACSRIQRGLSPFQIEKEAQYTKSAGEIELLNFVKQFDESAESSRKVIHPFEVDIFLKNKNFAIEYNGIYWHSDIFKSEDYHQKKTDLCAEKGITLFHVFEDEWTNKREIVESMIKHRLGCSKKIGARQCTVVFDTRLAHELMKLWHLDGEGRTPTYGWVLYHEGIPVCSVTFGAPFHKKWRQTNCVELLRSASHPGLFVVGGLSKLLSAAEKELSKKYSSILTYVDLRSGTGKSYERCGFKFLYRTQPRFWWITRDGKRLNRFSVKASSEFTQNEAAMRKLCFKIYSCSNGVFLKPLFEHGPLL